jgi:hypothetical protein
VAHSSPLAGLPLRFLQRSKLTQSASGVPIRATQRWASPDKPFETLSRNARVKCAIVLSMKPGQEELAKQIITYADAITAFSFVQSTAFGFALGGHEFRDSMLKIPHPWIWCIPIAYFIYIAFVLALWLAYTRALSAKEDELCSNEYSLERYLWFGRIGVVVLAMLLSGLALGFTIYGAGSTSPVPQVRARSLYIQARSTRSSGANLGFATFRRRQP